MRKAFILLPIIFLAFNLPHLGAQDQIDYGTDFIDDAYDVKMGERYTRDGMIFIVKEAQVGEWVTMESAQSIPFYSSPASQGRSPILALRYDFINDNLTKKVDITKSFKFELLDEYNNTYRMLERPLDYLGATQFYGNSFPSLYPGERMGETIFFEAPIDNSKHLFLVIDARNIGIEDSVVIGIPIDQVESFDPGFYARFREEEEKIEAQAKIGPIKIVSPKNRSYVAPGEVVQLKVEVPQDSQAPDSVFVLIPSFVLRDNEPRYSYDLTIPKSQKDPLRVLVIGKWNDGQEEELLSDSIVLMVDENSL